MRVRVGFSRWVFSYIVATALLGCGDGSDPADVVGNDAIQSDMGGLDVLFADVSDTGNTAPTTWTVQVTVLLDGQPVSGALVMQGGTVERLETGVSGTVTVGLDLTVPGELGIVAAHPKARSQAETFVVELGLPSEVIINLKSYDPTDNEDYTFGDPGRPDENSSTQCRHCHETLTFAWFDSPHRTSASNVRVHDLYAGVAAAYVNEADCKLKGGTWALGIEPGTGRTINRCYIGDGLLPAANPSCADGPCETPPDEYGGCADCHAPGINGKLGGRDLLSATGIAYEYGVHCDVCHRVDSVDLSQPPGVAGRLRLHRPSEKASSPALGDFFPLTFGPDPDVPLVRMGGVARSHFRDSTLCAGCHELEHSGFGSTPKPDPARWPSGKLPVQSTFSEWEQGPYNPGAPCQSCHMEPVPMAQNGADVQHLSIGPGLIAGWERPPGAVRQHSFVGPRQPESRMLQLAAAVFVEHSVNNGSLEAKVRTRNVGPGHAIPTGEPMRALILVVQAFCGETELVATGGDAVLDIGGYLDRREAAQGYDTWPGAQVGDVIRVVQTTGGFHDYQGFGPFGDGTFTPEQKGLPKETVVGQATVVAVVGDAVTLSEPLALGSVAYRARPGSSGDSQTPMAWAGASGFAFARVLVGADGRRMVPHFVATDIASDNRLLPQQEWETTHTFTTTCAQPTVRATLYYRPVPMDLAMERGWATEDTIMVQVQR